MKEKKIKVLVLYNEAHPEYYHKTAEPTPELDFKTYFEIEDLTPMEEFEIIAKRLKKLGFDAYAVNLKDDIFTLLKEAENNKPDVIFNFVEIYKDQTTVRNECCGIV